MQRQEGLMQRMEEEPKRPVMPVLPMALHRQKGSMCPPAMHVPPVAVAAPKGQGTLPTQELLLLPTGMGW